MQERFVTRQGRVPLKLRSQNQEAGTEEVKDSQIPAGEASEDENVRSNSNPVGESPSARYVVLGDLVLPRPPNELRAHAESVEGDLKALNDRNMDGQLLCLSLLFLCKRTNMPFPELRVSDH